jgi:hypothetical protein
VFGGMVNSRSGALSQFAIIPRRRCFHYRHFQTTARLAGNCHKSSGFEPPKPTAGIPDIQAWWQFPALAEANRAIAPTTGFPPKQQGDGQGHPG